MNFLANRRRIVRVVLEIEGVVLMALGAGGLVAAALEGFAQANVHVLAFHLNAVHSSLLLATGLAAVVVAALNRYLAAFSLVQAIGYFLLFVFGTSYRSVESGGEVTSLGLNVADHVLHATLSILGLILALTVSNVLVSADAIRASRGAHPHKSR
jgi:uncharacterized membrane protein (UPF0136 family)